MFIALRADCNDDLLNDGPGALAVNRVAGDESMRLVTDVAKQGEVRPTARADGVVEHRFEKKSFQDAGHESVDAIS